MDFQRKKSENTSEKDLAGQFVSYFILQSPRATRSAPHLPQFQPLERQSNLNRKFIKISLVHAAGISINFAFCKEIINSDIPFIMVVYEKIFGSINK